MGSDTAWRFVKAVEFDQESKEKPGLVEVVQFILLGGAQTGQISSRVGARALSGRRWHKGKLTGSASVVQKLTAVPFCFIFAEVRRFSQHGSAGRAGKEVHFRLLQFQGVEFQFGARL